MSMVQLQRILNNYKINATVINENNDAPNVTTYEISLGVGVRDTVLKRFQNDIARDLRVSNVFIETIYERGTCGIQVPKENKDIVNIIDLFDSSEFINSKSPISFIVGIDTNGKIVVGDLKKMPHLLVAGATGMGKSVFLNSFTSSILYKSKPNHVKFLMIDPKAAELIGYNDLPHMLCPTITDSQQAIKALEWVTLEMDRRYAENNKNSVHYGIDIRDIDTFNSYMKDEDHRPHIVVIIDEFQDLMMTSSNKKQLEHYIARIGQKARAAGIHLVLATQRPEVKVVTGTIKANIPSRIAFSTADVVNSRIIIDGKGAESLTGDGDMFYKPVGAKFSRRVQGAFISDDEIRKLKSFICKQYKAKYDECLLKMLSDGGSNNANRILPCYQPLIDDVYRRMGKGDYEDKEANEFHELYIMGDLAAHAMIDNSLDRIAEDENKQEIMFGYEDLAEEGFTVDEIAVMDDEELDEEDN